MDRRLVAWVLAGVALLTGCGGYASPMAPAVGEKEKPYAIVKTFFATDRKLTGDTDPDEMFGTDRGTLAYGTCDVSIPRDHKMGELESPLIKMDWFEDPEKHVVLRATTVQSAQEFFAGLSARANMGGSAFVFVHGYNVSFEDAARRTAQMAYDLAFPGAPVFYSWPSQENPLLYTIDEQNIEWTQHHLQEFLERFFAETTAPNVYLIAHSMGNRALSRVVGALASNAGIRARLREVILAAPDIDAEVFKTDIAPALKETGKPVTLYASSNDKALLTSMGVHGYPRAGDSGAGLVVLPWIETIDASSIDTSFLGHSYFAEGTSVLGDMFCLFNRGQRAAQRIWLQSVNGAAGQHWEFVPAKFRQQVAQGTCPR